jgi:hypothetical protein
MKIGDTRVPAFPATGTPRQQVRTPRTETKTPETAPAAPAQQQVLTDAERSFFEGLFPGSATEIRGHLSYTRAGKQPVQNTGSVIDRKG